MFSATPPPKRNSDQRVLKEELVTVTYLQLPKRAHASLRLHNAIRNRHIFAADEMETVVVTVDAVVNMEAIHVDERGLDDAYAVVRALEEVDIPN